MPHLIPAQVLQDGDLPDAEVLNTVFLPIAQKLSGRINEQDIDGTTPFAYANLTSSCYYTVHQAVAACDPALLANGWFRQGGAGPDDNAPFADSYAWSRIDDMLVSLTTGEDMLWVIGQVQHAAWKGQAGDYATTVPSINTPMRLQYAVQVDSILVDATITGAATIPDTPPQEWYRVQPDPSGAPDEFDWRRIQYLQDTVGVNSFAHPTRMMTVVPVAPGDHDVEIIGRRVPNLQGKIDEEGEGVYAEGFNRRLAVIRIKGSSEHVGGASTLDVSAWEDGDVISQASLVGRLNAIKNKINDLGTADLERGALNHEHIPSVIVFPSSHSIVPGADVPVTTVYGGFGIDTGVQWTVISDGVGDNLRTNVAMDFTGRVGVLVVLANVQVVNVDQLTFDEKSLGILALRYHNTAGTNTVLGETEVYLNAHNPDPVTSDASPINDDAPLTWVVDVADLAGADRLLSYIEVVGSTWDGVGAASAVTMKTRRATISAFFIEGATLA